MNEKHELHIKYLLADKESGAAKVLAHAGQGGVDAVLCCAVLCC